MQIEDRLLIGNILVNEFGRLASELDPKDARLPEIINRASMCYLKMKIAFRKWNEPPEMVEQMFRMDAIIAMLEGKQKK